MKQHVTLKLLVWLGKKILSNSYYLFRVKIKLDFNLVLEKLVLKLFWKMRNAWNGTKSKNNVLNLSLKWRNRGLQRLDWCSPYEADEEYYLTNNLCPWSVTWLLKILLHELVLIIVSKLLKYLHHSTLELIRPHLQYWTAFMLLSNGFIATI